MQIRSVGPAQRQRICLNLKLLNLPRGADTAAVVLRKGKEVLSTGVIGPLPSR